MGWSEQEWKEFCELKGVNVREAIRSGQVHLDPKHEQPTKKRTKGPPTARVSHTLVKQDREMALDPPVARTQPLVEDISRKPRIRIIIRGCRLRFLDPDNFVGSCKALVDGIIRAGIASDDSAKAVAAGEVEFCYEQQLVTAYTKECTEIELIWSADMAG